MTILNRDRIITIMLLTVAIIFFFISTLFIYQDKYLQALFTFIIGVILLSSSLAVMREYIMHSIK